MHARWLQAIYGELAFGAIIPRSYLLPSQYWMWRGWLVVQHALSMRQHAGGDGGGGGHGMARPPMGQPGHAGDDSARPWVLKSDAHRGAGGRACSC